MAAPSQFSSHYIMGEEDLLPLFNQAFKAITGSQNNPQLMAGISGGADSLAMLHLLSRLSEERDFEARIVHVDHMIRPDSSSDAAFVKEVTENLGFEFILSRVNVQEIASKRKVSLEEAARKARYSALLSAASEAGAAYILVAHNRNDQVETILAHIFRGSGLDGLSGMSQLSPLSDTHLLEPMSTGILIARPMLAFSREEIERYCLSHNLSPREDSTNQDERYLRNYLRHSLIPMIESRFTHFDAHLLTLATIAESESALVQELAEETLSSLTVQWSERHLILTVKGFSALPVALQRRVLRTVYRQMTDSLADLAFGHVETTRLRLIEGPANGTSEWPGGFRITRQGDEIIFYLEGAFPVPDWPAIGADEDIPIDLRDKSGVIIGDFTCEFSLIDGYEAIRRLADKKPNRWQAYIDTASIRGTPSLRARKAGDRFRPHGAPGSVSLGDFMTNEKVPRVIRDSLPLLADDDGILWVSGYRIAHRCLITPETRKALAIEFVRK